MGSGGSSTGAVTRATGGWVQRNVEDLSHALVEEFEAEQALIERQTREVVELRAELHQTQEDVARTWQLTQPLLLRLRMLDDVKSSRTDQATMVRAGQGVGSHQLPQRSSSLSLSLPLSLSPMCAETNPSPHGRCETTPSRPPSSGWSTRCQRSHSGTFLCAHPTSLYTLCLPHRRPLCNNPTHAPLFS